MKIPNAIHKFVLHKKKKKYGKYVCTSSYRINRKQTAERAYYTSQKKLFLRCLSAKA